MTTSLIDIHCHMLPGIDDGAKDWDESLAMARLAVEDGIETVITTPHQLGAFRHNNGDLIRDRTQELQARLTASGVPLTVLSGADVRIESDLIEQLVRGDVLSLADHRRHVLLELPHELYLPLEPLLERLSRQGIVGILSHPERNAGILRRPDVLPSLVDAGCLLQITAGSLCGTFGSACQQLAEWILAEGLAHFIATDAHGSSSRRPLLRRAFQRVVELAGDDTAIDLCRRNSALVASGRSVQPGRRTTPQSKRSWWSRKVG
jgi:protein-tyrosine phosphatase